MGGMAILIALDTVVICWLVRLFDKERQMEWGKAALCAVAVYVATFIVSMLVVALDIWSWSALDDESFSMLPIIHWAVSLITAFIVTGLAFRLVFGMPFARVAIATSLFFGYRICLVIAGVLVLWALFAALPD